MRNKTIAITALALSLIMTKTAFAYDVQAGDTMSKIARTNGVSLSEMIQANPQIKNPNALKIGQKVNTKIKRSNFTKEDIDLLARLVRAEADGEPFEGKKAVVEVVLNRLASAEFPKTLQEVIYQKNQFTPVSNGKINKPTNAECVKAVEAVLSSKARILPTNTYYFYNPKTAISRWLDTRATVKVISNHTFKR